MKKIISVLVLFCALSLNIGANSSVMAQGNWINDLKDTFIANRAIILAINIRTFNAKDLNNNDIIEPEKGETSGNFVNAIDRLDELKAQGINTVHLLPITPVGKVKAIGTAGSLYAISSFTELNPQLDDTTNNLSVKDEAKKFISECHKRNIRVIVDLPSCGSYDMFLAHPNLFITNKEQQPTVPSDWTDVRLFKVTNNDGSLNKEVYEEFKSYIDMVQSLGADGIRADVASSKPAEFWNQLIKYAKSNDSQFLFLAEASDSWFEPVAPPSPFPPSPPLLEAGFDGFYGSFMNFKDWKNVVPFEQQMNMVKDLKTKYSSPKSVIGSFSTHDEVSPILLGKSSYSSMLIWLQSTLPINSYYVDGFQTGDSYTYKYANQKAAKTYTDDDYYYVHKGKIDIFNFSRKPGTNNTDLMQEFAMGNNIKIAASEMINKGSLTFLKTNNPSIFAYVRTLNRSTIIVIINKDMTYNNVGTIYYKGVSPDSLIVPIRVPASPFIKKNEIKVDLPPAGVIVLTMDSTTNWKK